MVHHTGAGSARPTAVDTATWQISAAAGWPFPTLAYLIYIEPDATIDVCGNLEEERWSNGVGSPTTDANGEGSFNASTVAICFSGQDPTDAQWAAIKRTYFALNVVLGRTLALTGHRLVAPGTTDCPGDVAASRLEKP